MNPYFEQQFHKRIKEMVQTREDVILRGLDSRDEYLQTVGHRKGLLAALDTFKEIYESMENE
jgi:hypothetical protein